jgi:plasmid stabilization system protein ParE
MDNYRFRFTDEAREEYEATAVYYAENGGLDVANRFTITVDTVIGMLEMWPGSGQVLEEIPEIKFDSS